ncbi:transglutaminase domain-containing protein [Malacoplasma iowae]|uniref:transglutaminase domain-containing protein n=1 Tax=Malacoplasma iowae TaxID=2116 RepID=UPI0038733CAB|nr:transglutaminase-like domain-containing protein [Malacoplasma iowae]
MKKWKKLKIMMIGSTALAGLLILPTVLTSCWNGSNLVTNTPDTPTIVPPTDKPGSAPGEDNTTTPPVNPPVDQPETSPEIPPEEKPVEPPVVPDEKEYIKDVDYMLAPNTPKDQEQNQEYWITNPNTQNKNILTRWGNVPLPMKEKVSEKEVYDYFTYIVNNGQLGRVHTFGQRKIETDWLSNIYIKWLAENWALYPWISFENIVPYFHTDSDDLSQKFDYDVLNQWRNNYTKFFDEHKFYVKESKIGNTADLITIQSEQRDAFFQMVRLFLTNYYRPDMSDLDKALSVFNFVMSYIAYGDSAVDPYGAYMKHLGVCVHYAFTAAFLLNLIGVPAFMNTAGDMFSHPQVSYPGHAVTWVWIDADNSNQKKWYIMDATSGDYKAETTWPSAYVISNGGGAWGNFLEPVSDIEGGNIDYSLKQNSFFRFLSSPWYSPFKNKQVKVSSDRKYLENLGTYTNIRNGFGNLQNKQSRPVWYKNEWYSMIIDNQRKIKFYKTSMNNSNREEFSIPQEILNNLYSFGDKRYSSPYLGLYNDWMAFSVFERPNYMEPKPVNSKTKIYFHNFKDTNWENTKSIDIPNEVLYKDENGVEYKTEKAFFQTFFFDNDKLYIEYSFKDNGGKTIASIIKKYDLPTEVQVKNDQYLDSSAVKTASIYYKLIGNTHQIGTENQQTTLEKKNEYNEYFKNFKTSESAYNDLVKLKNYSDEFEKSLLSKKGNIASSVSSDIYLIDKDSFEKYGYYFDNINPGFDSFHNLSKDQYNTTLLYDIYFLPKDSNKYELIANDLYKPIIKKSYFEKYSDNPNGKYYIKMHNNDNSIEYNTDPFYFAITDDDNVVNQPEQPNIEYTDNTHPSTPVGQTNYYDKFVYNWYDQRYTLSLNYNWSQIRANYDTKVYLKRYDFKTKQLNTLQTWDNPLRKEKYVIGKVGEDNKGIYFMDVEVKYKTNNQVFHLYSPFMYMITKNDVDTKNFDKWIELSNDLKQKIRPQNNKPINIVKQF